MQSKQQKQIKVFLIQTFGGSRGDSLFSRQEKILDRLIKTAANRSKNQMKTLVQTILPRIALYKVLQAELPAEETFTHMRTYMMDWVAAEKHAFTAENGVCAGNFIGFTAIVFSKSCVPPTCGRAHRNTTKRTFPRRLPSVSGTRRAGKTAVRSCVRCFATWMT